MSRSVRVWTESGPSPLLQLIQMFESREHDLLARLFDLACEKDLV